MSAITNDLSFLGEEFLTWLWFRSETGASTFQIQGEGEVGITLDDFLCLGGMQDETEQTLRRGLPTRSPEATAALRTGKRLVKARLVVACGSDEWTVTLDGPRLGFSTVRPSGTDPDDVAEGRDLARMHAFLRLSQLLDGVYRIFLRERLRPEFAGDHLPEMRKWLRARGDALSGT